jgi:tetratricopeptide (TPR) repeat protein
MLSAATFHRDRGELDEALDAYKKALMVAPEDLDAVVLASIYASIGQIKSTQGKREEAENNFGKALRHAPLQRRALQGLIELASEAKNTKRVAELRASLAKGTSDPAEKADELSRLATVLADDLGDARGAAVALEEASELRPGDPVVLTRLRELYDGLGDGEGLARVIGALCLEEDRKPVRSALRFEQAKVIEEKVGDVARAISLLEGALEEDPTNDRAIDRLVALRTEREEWPALERVYARLIDRAAEARQAKRAGDLCKRLAHLRRDRLSDLEGAIEALSGAVRCDGTDPEARAELAEAFLQQGDGLAAVFELEGAASIAPRRVDTFARLFDIHRREGRTDRAYLAAMALEELGAAEVDHEMVAAQYRPEGLLRPASSLDDAAWDHLLRAPGWDSMPGAILRAGRDAAIAARMAELGEKRTRPPEASRRIDPTSTISVARAFHWAASLLGVEAPDLIASDDAPGGLAAMALSRPTTLVASSVSGGRPMQEVVFLAARHLTYYRPEHELLFFYPTLPALSALFVASLRIVLPKLDVPSAMDARIRRESAAIAERLTPEAKADLEDAVARFESAGGKADLGVLLKAVERTACRAGLVLSGDLAVAARVLRTEQRDIAELDAEARIDDLLAFCASQELAVLREWLGVAARPSMRPPRLV